MDFRDIREFFIDTAKYIITAVVVLFILIYVIAIQQVVGASMNPTLKDGDILLLGKIQYKIFDVKRGDVIAMNDESSKFMVKRIVGLPGETVECKEGKIYIDGKAIKDDFANITNDFQLQKVSNNQYFVLGDNRTDSRDSRNFGPITKKQLIGKVYFRFWPMNKMKGV